eukprot:gene8569-6010_t
MNYIARPRLTQKISVPAILKGDRRALAKAITLAESANPAHSTQLSELLREIHQTKAIRTVPHIALSGSPGAGKSTLLESLGYYLCTEKKMKVGVLAVDPTSTLSNGSILGDKTRMEKLSTHENSYIRPSPSGGHLGGVTARAWEVMEVMDAAQFDVVFVETVGVGQSEMQCKDLTDMMVLLVPPASGDELQGIKKGIVEVADMVVVTKNDGPRKLLAQQTKSAYTRAVMYTEMQQGFSKPVIAVSSEEGTNIPLLWDEIMKMWTTRLDKGKIPDLRRAQSAKHFVNYFEMELLAAAKRLTGRAEMNRIAKAVWDHEATPREAGDRLIERVLRKELSPAQNHIGTLETHTQTRAENQYRQALPPPPPFSGAARGGIHYYGVAMCGPSAAPLLQWFPINELMRGSSEERTGQAGAVQLECHLPLVPFSFAHVCVMCAEPFIRCADHPLACTKAAPAPHPCIGTAEDRDELAGFLRRYLPWAMALFRAWVRAWKGASYRPFDVPPLTSFPSQRCLVPIATQCSDECSVLVLVLHKRFLSTRLIYCSLIRFWVFFGYRFAVKTFHEAGELSSIAQRSLPRLPAVDHLAIDVTHLASSAARFTREYIGRERDEEAVKILARTLNQNVLRRLKVKKSVAFFMDGADPLWKVYHLRQFPGKVFDRAFYRSAASPAVYLMEEFLFKAVEELRGSSQVQECIVSGPSTPGPAAAKISAWLLDLSTRAVPPAALNPHSNSPAPESSPAISGAAVTPLDSIVIVGSQEDVHLNAWGATTWTPAAPAAFTTVSLDQRDAYSLTLADSLEWLTMGDVYAAAAATRAPLKPGAVAPAASDSLFHRHALSALRTDAVLLNLLAHGSAAVGLPPVSSSISFAQWMTAYGQEMARQVPGGAPATAAPAASPVVMGRLVHEYPRVLSARTAEGSVAVELEPTPLRLNVESLRRVLAGAAQRPPPAPVPVPGAAPAGKLGGAASSPGGRYHAGAEHYLEVLLQALHAYTHGFLPNPLYMPAESKANFGEKGMRGVTAEHILLHLQFLAEQAPQDGAAAAAAKAGKPQQPVNTRRVLLTPKIKAQERPPAAASFVELFTRCARPASTVPAAALTGAQQLCLCSTKPEYMQQVLPVMARGHAPAPAQVASIAQAKTFSLAVETAQRVVPVAPAPVEGEAVGVMDGALRFHPSHYFTRSGAAALSPWQHYAVHLGLKAEALNIRCTAAVEDPAVIPRICQPVAGTPVEQPNPIPRGFSPRLLPKSHFFGEKRRRRDRRSGKERGKDPLGPSLFHFFVFLEREGGGGVISPCLFKPFFPLVMTAASNQRSSDVCQHPWNPFHSIPFLSVFYLHRYIFIALPTHCQVCCEEVCKASTANTAEALTGS